MKKTKFIVLMLILMLLIIFPHTVNARQISPNVYEPNEINEEDVKQMYKFGGKIAGVLQIVGNIVSVGAMMIIGIRYVISSAEEKAELKERLFPFFIGAVLLFGASNIVNIIFALFD